MTENDRQEGSSTSIVNEQKPTENSAPAVVPSPSSELDGFNMADFVVNQHQPVMVRKVIIQVLVKKPNPQKFFRVLPGSQWEVSVPVLEMKEEGDYYLVHPDVLPYLVNEVRFVRINVAYYLNGSVFLIPTPLPDAENPMKWNPWHRSLDTVVKRAKEGWVRSVADRSISGYNLLAASGNYECPQLPTDMTLNDYLRIAFREKIIDSPDHPIVRRLLGEA